MPAQQRIGDFAPKLVELIDNVLFGDVWQRPGLSPQERSLVTVTALTSLCRTEQIRSHLKRALDSLTREELAGPVEIRHHKRVAGPQVVQRGGEAGPLAGCLSGADLLDEDPSAPPHWSGAFC
jgi:alkylhydroperoxidase/carboxymuconolactone decarboxylase family protein YurZ